MKQQQLPSDQANNYVFQSVKHGQYTVAPYPTLAPIVDLTSQFSTGLNSISHAILFLAERQKRLEDLYEKQYQSHELNIRVHEESK